VETGALDFDIATAAFSKGQEQGTLRLEMVVDGRVVQSQETPTEFGGVDVNYMPGD
jgi:hypothetical protein